ncbi:putative disease resistance protein At1g50180 isoform X2 [Salvia hispanica]|uniref:putative disease resistance protein At1g50180 isoform X2 n=1 Tax=Salvia hispanica TaxID=49212 RepID=UPI0020098B86|nr:putative disease resistance protein At1g50180 isoform X2 [Salvia hispanica]
MAESAVSSAVELLGNLLIDEVKSLRGVKGKVRLLKDELKSMQSFLKDADRKQAKDERVRNWVRELREIAFDAEDTIELFAVNIENTTNTGFLKSFTGFPKRFYHVDRIGGKIKSIRDRLEAIDKSRERYGIQIAEEAEKEMSQVELRRQLCPWQKDEHLVGMQDAVEKVLREAVLDEEKRGLLVVEIQGMGGIGKSTLAREIYNHPDVVDGPFDRRGWVVVSSEFTPQEKIKQLIYQVSSEEKKSQLLEEIQKLEQSTKDKLFQLQELRKMLHTELKGKTYVIVLDDVWEQDHWEYFESAFPQDKTSRLILTTRNKIIIAKLDQYVLQKSLLDPEKSWELFLKKAFIKNTNGTCPEELESIGRQILKKCGGLPLAISVVGGLLVDTQDKSGWQQVLSHIDSYSNIPENNVPNILNILELSYQNLSLQLKSCFLCLAVFKEDSIIPVKWLASIWNAHGLMQEKGDRIIEDIGRDYLNELINRSMLQIHDLTIDGQVKSFRLHDLIRDVCISKAKEEMGVKIVKGEEDDRGCSSESLYKPRHHVICSKSFVSFSSNQNKYLRSVFHFNLRYFSIEISSRYWKNFQLLKILYLDGFWFKKFPNSFWCLVGLKYLRINTHRHGIHLKLPSWLSDFKKLEFLYVEFVEFPDVDLRMESLRDFGTSKILGRAMTVSKWKSIESLKGIRLKDLVEMSSGLMPNSQLRKLKIDVDDDDGDLVTRGRASLQKMTNLVDEDIA